MSVATPFKRYVPLRALFRCLPLTYKVVIACIIVFALFNGVIVLSAPPALAYASEAIQPLADWMATFIPAFDAAVRQIATPRDAFMIVPVKAELAINFLLSAIFPIIVAVTAWIDLRRNPDGVRAAAEAVFSRSVRSADEAAALFFLFSIVAFGLKYSGVAIRIYALSAGLTVFTDYIVFCCATVILCAGIVSAMIARQNRLAADRAGHRQQNAGSK